MYTLGMIYALSHYPLDLSGGGSVRALNVWKIFSKIYNETVISYALAADSKQSHINGILEKHVEKPFLLRNISGGYLCAFPLLIKRQLISANIFYDIPSVVILEGPYMGYAVLKAIGFPKTSIIIYDAQNVEANYHSHYFNRNPLKRLLLDKIGAIEKRVIQISDYVLSTSTEESKILEHNYRLSPENLILVPNGVDTDAIKPPSFDQRASLRSKFSITTPLVLFMGSSIEANISAGKWVSEYLASKIPEVTFFIIGGVCEKIGTTSNNVKLLGTVSNSEKNDILQIADVAINPVRFGAGTNVKMLEYLAAGLPIVSTRVGIRGLDLNDGEDVIVCDLEEFPVYIRQILNSDPLQVLLRENSRRKAQKYEWKNIALSVKSRLDGGIAP